MISCRGLLHHGCLCEYRKCEEKASDGSGNKEDGTIILGVKIHCEGCAKKVWKSLSGFEGVEGVDIDAKNDKVKVMGKKADPTKVAVRVRKKTGKHVELISPKPKKKEDKEEKKPEQPKVTAVVLKINMHCERCAKEVQKCICKMEGVQRVGTDVYTDQVTVKGTMDPNKLVEFISKRCGRHADIVKKDDGDGGRCVCGGRCGCGGCGGRCGCGGHCCSYPPETVCAPQLFSDENPNACSVM